MQHVANSTGKFSGSFPGYLIFSGKSHVNIRDPNIPQDLGAGLKSMRTSFAVTSLVPPVVRKCSI